MKQTDARTLEAHGWTVVKDDPLELFHEDSQSRATGMAARIILEDVLRIDEAEAENHGHTIDKHSSCKFCRSPVKVNILRPDRCVNLFCTNYYRRKENNP